MRVAVNARLLLGHRMEGVARYIYETSTRMVQHNPEVEFHFYFDRKYTGPPIEGKNVVFHVLHPQARHPLLWYWWFEWVLAKAMKKDQIDVLYSGESYLSERSQIPTVMVSHDITYIHYPEFLQKSHLKYFKKYFPRFHKKADRIITVSEFTKGDIVSSYGLDPDKVSVAYNAVPAGFETLREKEKEDIRNKYTHGNEYLVYVGSLHPRKNVENLLKAYEKYKTDPGGRRHLVIFGRAAWETSKIYELYHQSDWKQSIHFYSDNEISVKKVMGASSGLCYVSLFEGFGIPILEAFSCEVPVITSNISSMPEVAGDAAILVDPQNVNHIADAMLRLETDPELVNKLIAKGKERKQFFSWEKSARLIMSEIKNLI